MRTPEFLWKQLLVRGDAQIGIQELLAVILAIWSLDEWVRDSLTFLWEDNQGVLHSLLKGGCAAWDANLCIAQVWLQFARVRAAFAGYRVESKANPADLPTRDDLSLIKAYDMEWVEPKLPSFLNDIWACADWEKLCV